MSSAIPSFSRAASGPRCWSATTAAWWRGCIWPATGCAFTSPPATDSTPGSTSIWNWWTAPFATWRGGGASSPWARMPARYPWSWSLSCRAGCGAGPRSTCCAAWPQTWWMPRCGGPDRSMVEERTMAKKQIRVEVAHALPERQKIIALEVEEGCTVYEAAERSGIQQQFPGLDLATSRMGVFGKVVAKPRETVLAGGDRVEIYRPLLIDPKQVRRQRAADARAKSEA